MSNQGDFVGRIQDNWRQRASERTTFWAELRVIPRWLVWVMLTLYIVAVAVVVGLGLFAPERLGPPVVQNVFVLLGFVTVGAAGLGVIVLFYGYIAADAKRRGMNPVLWLLVALLIPYLIGAILYFVVREPMPVNCPQCGRKVDAHFNFCPSCNFNLRRNCPQCRRAIRAGDRFCPHCGFSLQQDTPAS